MYVPTAKNLIPIVSFLLVLVCCAVSTYGAADGQTGGTPDAVVADTARVGVPYEVCKGTDYAFRLSVADGRSSYQWFLDGVAIEGAVSSTYVATSAGSYSVVVGGVGPVSSCPSASCAPFVIREVEVPTFSLVATSATCADMVVQPNGTLTVTGLSSTTGLTYELVRGRSFETDTVLTRGRTQLPPTNVVSNALGAGTYWMRIYNKLGCFQEVNALIRSTPCECPPAKCLPLLVRHVSQSSRVIIPPGSGGR